ncbi:MAG: CPBP family intramembrane glutamic endopeptidase [Vulcanimicrobiaceae bacterium]
MENNSTSQLSPAWPTVWPSQAFKALPTVLTVIVAVVAGAIGAGIALGILLLLHPEVFAGIPIRMAFRLTDALWVQFAFEAPIVATLIVALPRLTKLSYRDLGFSIPPLSSLTTVAFGAIAMILVTDLSASLITKLAHTTHKQGVVELLKQAHSPASIIGFIAFAVVLAPIAEETVFRLFLFTIGLRYGGFWIGAVTSAVLFGAAHGDIYFLIPLALAGLILATVYYRTRNAFCSMMVHATFNATTVIALFASGSLHLHL